MRKLALAALLLASPALAQQPAGTPSEQALGNRLIAEINAGIKCDASLITLQHQLADAQARIRELEAKAVEPKK